MRGKSLAGLLALASLDCSLPSPEELEAELGDCKEEAFASPALSVGINAYYLQEEATRALRRGEPRSAVVDEILQEAAALGVSFIRTNGYNDGSEQRGDSAIQIAPLVYDELALRGLDLVLAQAHIHGLRLVLPLGNYWDDYGGARRYVDWAGLPSPQRGDPRFFTERRIIDHYKSHIQHLLNRVNTVDGIRYADHPAVLAWELLNEPRGNGLDEKGETLRAWVDEVGAVVRDLAPRHHVATGEEGFDSLANDEAGSAFHAGVSGISYSANIESSAITLASIHLYPLSWNVELAAIGRATARFIRDRARQAHAHSKPLLLGEFGLPRDGALDLAARRALYRGWFRCARALGVAAAPWMLRNDTRPPEWDPHSFAWHNGTSPADLENEYVDLIAEAAQ